MLDFIRIPILILIVVTYSFSFEKMVTIKDNTNIKIIKDGTLFDSRIIKDKMFLVNYIDPDEKELNKELMDKIEAIHPDIGVIAIINLEATWLPNAILEGVLKTNQEKHPTTIFVKDYNKEFVKLWNLPDDSYVVMVFNENGERIFIKDGKLNIKEQKKVIDLLMGK